MTALSAGECTKSRSITGLHLDEQLGLEEGTAVSLSLQLIRAADRGGGADSRFWANILTLPCVILAHDK
jgi:hypothetical protein